MKNIERSVRLMIVPKTSTFLKQNSAVLGIISNYLGSSERAYKILNSRNDLMEALLPDIIGVGKTDVVFKSLSSKYLHEVGVNTLIDLNGKKLDISIEVDIHDHRTKANIEALKLKEVTDETVSEYILKSIAEIDIFKYASPVNKEDYILYLFALNHSRVAPTPDKAHSSDKIDYYLLRDSDIADTKRKSLNTAKSLRQALNKIDDDKDLFKNLCLYFNINGSMLDKTLELETKATTTPELFLEAYNDTNLLFKVEIKRMINANILKRMPNTEMHVDVDDPSIVLGLSENEVVSYLSSANNAAYLNSLRAKLQMQEKRK